MFGGMLFVLLFYIMIISVPFRSSEWSRASSAALGFAVTVNAGYH
jgi:hypothetical protein